MGKTLAIIPARGGSKRIVRKNIREFAGRPILAWSVECARASELFDEIMVSTDDPAIAEIAQEAGAKVPFMRSAQSADDHATIADCLREVLHDYRQRGEEFDQICCLFATAPMMQAQDLKAGRAMLESGSFSVILPVARFAYPIHRSLMLDSDGRVALTFPDHAETRSQDLPHAYHDAGQWVWLTPDALENGTPLIGPHTGSLVIDAERVADIDTEDDWRAAEWKFARLRQLEAAS